MTKRTARTCWIATLLVLLGCSKESGPAAAGVSGPEPGPPVAVRLAEVREDVWERSLRVTGELAAFEEATLSTKVAGRLEVLSVDLGTRVKKGDLVASIETRDYQLRVAQAEAAVQAARARLGLLGDDGEQSFQAEHAAIVRAADAELSDARRAHERLAGLMREGNSSQSLVDAAEARLLTAESQKQEALEEVSNRLALLAQRRAELEIARAQLENTSIVAPFDGAVAQRLAGTGDYLDQGAPVARLVRFDPLRLELEIPERATGALRAGLAVKAVLDGSEQAIEGTLVRLSPEIARRSRSLVVEAEVPNPDGRLRPGAFARAEIVLDSAARTLVVPPEAIVRFAGVEKVFVVVDGKAVEKHVTAGRSEEQRIEILDGLVAGDSVVLAPGSLRAGTSVQPAQP